MRALKWFSAIFFLLILLPIAGLFAIISGFWTVDLRVEKDSIALKQIKERLGYEITITEPIRVKISKEFALLGKNISIRPVASNAEMNLIDIGFLDFYGNMDSGILFGDLPHVKKLITKNVFINIESNDDNPTLATKVSAFLAQNPSEHTGLSNIISPAFAQEDTEYLNLNALPIDEIAMEDITISISNQNTTYHIDVHDIAANKPIDSSDGFLRMIGLMDNAPFEVDISITAQGSVSGNVDLLDVKAKIDGQALGDLNIDTTINISNTAQLSNILSQSLPKGPFSITGNIQQKKNLIQIALQKFQATNTQFSGDASISIRGRGLNAEFKGTKLDIADFIVTASNEEKSIAQANLDPENQESNQTATGNRLIPNTALPEVLLKSTFLPKYSDASIHLTLQTVIASPLILQDVDVNLSADDHGAEVDINNISIGLGGLLTGQASIQVGDTPEIVTDLNLQSTPISTFQPFLPAISNLDGMLNAEIKGYTKGADFPALAAAYTGDIKLSLYGGYVRLPEKAHNILAAVAPSVLDEGLLVIKCTDIQTSLQDGIDENFNGVIMSPSLIGYGGGGIDLGTETTNMDYITEMTVLDSNLGLPITVNGALAAPKFKGDFNTLLSGNVSRKIPLPDSNLSVCHDQVATNVAEEYSPSKSLLKLDALGNITELTNLKKHKATIQEKLENKLKEGALNTVIEKTVSSEQKAKVKNLIQDNLNTKQVDKIEAAGKKLLGGLLGN